jgi:endonuclease YncB( thermonuclease family)
MDACPEQVKNGFAWHYKKYQQEQDAQDRQRYASAENQAREYRVGLWRENNPNAPWAFRRLHRSQ